jgi:molecular chaperone GrpE
MTDDQTPASPHLGPDVDDPTQAARDGDEFLAAADAERIAALEAEVAALKDQALRYAAEAENTKRRAEREMNDARAFAIQKFATSLLGVADTLGRALQAAPKESADDAFKNFVLGIEMTEKELASAFERNGLKKIDPKPGEKFDPHQHQAVMQQETSEVEPGSVFTVLQAGYELMGRNVRPAMVTVAIKAAETAPPNPYAAAGEGPGGAIDRKA